jgi:hypothetical protein
MKPTGTSSYRVSARGSPPVFEFFQLTAVNLERLVRWQWVNHTDTCSQPISITLSILPYNYLKYQFI